MSPLFLTTRVAILAALASLTMSACGGGDSSADSSIAVSYDITNFNVSMPVGAHVFTSVTATLSSLPDGKVYAYLIADKPVLQAGATSISRNANGSYTATLEMNPALAVGNYTGTLALQLCKDSACSAKHSLTGSTLPYSIDVVAPIGLAVTENGVAPVLVNGWFYSVRAGDTVSVTSGVPATWSLRTVGGSNGLLSNVSQTPNVWTATISGSATTVELKATSTKVGSNFKSVYFSMD